jgi:hypothetical protein
VPTFAEAAGIAGRSAAPFEVQDGTVLYIQAVWSYSLLSSQYAPRSRAAPVVRRAHAEFVLLVVFARPSARWRSARSRSVQARGVGARAVALVVIGIHAARVIGVVPDLVDVAHQVAAGVDRLEHRQSCRSRSTRCSRTCPCRRRVEQRDFERLAAARRRRRSAAGRTRPAIPCSGRTA